MALSRGSRHTQGWSKTYNVITIAAPCISPKHNALYVLRCTQYVGGAHLAQRAALASEAMRGALPWVDERAPGARLILARVGRQAVVDAFLDDQGVQAAVEITDRRLQTCPERSRSIADWEIVSCDLRCMVCDLSVEGGLD